MIDGIQDWRNDMDIGASWRKVVISIHVEDMLEP